MRLLQVIDSIDPGHGGPVRFTLDVSAELIALGDEVEIAAFADCGATEASIGAAVHCLGPALGRYRFSSRGAHWMRTNARRFDAIVVHGIWQHSAWAASEAAFEAGIPCFIWPHGALDVALPRLYPFRHLKKIAYWAVRGHRMLERAAGICFANDREAERATAFPGRFRRLVPGIGVRPPPERSDRAIAALRARFPALDGAPTLVFLGRLQPIKGLELLIECLPELRMGAPFKLLIAGEGPPAYVAKLRRDARSLGCDRDIVWAGMLGQDEKWAALRQAHAFVLTSRQDSFAVAAIEALAVGTPVVLTENVGTSAVIAACGAGLVCAHERASALEALRHALSAQWRAQAAANAVRCYLENYTAASAARKLRAAIADASRNSAVR